MVKLARRWTCRLAVGGAHFLEIFAIASLLCAGLLSGRARWSGRTSVGEVGIFLFRTNLSLLEVFIFDLNELDHFAGLFRLSSVMRASVERLKVFLSFFLQLDWTSSLSTRQGGTAAPSV